MSLLIHIVIVQQMIPLTFFLSHHRLSTFEDNLTEATNKENTAKETYDKLMEEKNAQKESTEQALIDMSKEGETFACLLFCCCARFI